MVPKFYRRPDHVARIPGPMTEAQCYTYVERTQKHKAAIPAELTFEKVMANQSMHPCALADFMNFLKYVEHDAENLQFHLWCEDYNKRFYATKVTEQALSPPYIHPSSSTFVAHNNGPPQTASSSNTAVTTPAMNVRPSNEIAVANFNRSSADNRSQATASIQNSLSGLSSNGSSETCHVWEPFTIQPFRGEINQIISHYFLPDSPRELNLSQRERNAVIRAAQHTTHPSVFSAVANMIEVTLRNQSHPNFIRYSICNGNQPRIKFITANGLVLMIIGLFTGAMLLGFGAERWIRAIIVPIYTLGFILLISSYSGLCIILHGRDHRGLRPWEMFDNSHNTIAPTVNDAFSAVTPDEEASTSAGNSIAMRSLTDSAPTVPRYPLSVRSAGSSFDTFGSSNDWNNEPWHRRYHTLGYWKRIFTETVWIEDHTLRMLQHRIVIQSYLGGIAIGLIFAAAFIIPHGGQGHHEN